MKFTEIIENLLPGNHTSEVISINDARLDEQGRQMEKGWYIKSTEPLLSRDLRRELTWDYRERIGECMYNYYKIEI